MVQAGFRCEWPLRSTSSGIPDSGLSKASCKAIHQPIWDWTCLCTSAIASKENIQDSSSVTPTTLDARDKARPDLAACSRAAAAEQKELDGLLMSASNTLISLAEEARQFGEAVSLVDQRMAHCQDQLLAGVAARLEAQVTFMMWSLLLAPVACMFGMSKQQKAEASWHARI